MMTAYPTADERLARWVREHARSIRGYLLAFVRQPDAADDLLQEVFRKAWEGRDRYQEQGHERAYLLRIADRLLADRWRKERRSGGKEVQLDDDGWRQVEPAGTELAPTLALHREEWKQSLAEALNALNDSQKRVLLLRYYGEMEFADIARQMDTPLGTVLSHCHRGLAALRKLLVEK
jgi:RNA polymerase sigma-70 factor (ECF subfamily)